MNAPKEIKILNEKLDIFKSTLNETLEQAQQNKLSKKIDKQAKTQGRKDSQGAAQESK